VMGWEDIQGRIKTVSQHQLPLTQKIEKTSFTIPCSPIISTHTITQIIKIYKTTNFYWNTRKNNDKALFEACSLSFKKFSIDSNNSLLFTLDGKIKITKFYL
jgi:hypothetical protein